MQYFLPVLYAVFVWWFSTGAILFLNGLPARQFKWIMLGATVMLGGALLGLSASSAQTTVAGAYCAFTCAVLVWAWQEIAFLLGWITGARRTPCPPGATGWRRVRFAFEAIAHHEIALLVLAAMVAAITWHEPNQTGLWTFIALWIMRQSAKLNVFLGVRNLNEGFLPAHLQYLQTYFMRRSMNALFPVSVTLATMLAVLLWQSAMASSASAFTVASLSFLGALISLAVLEHWFMVLPLPSERLWNWGLASRKLRAESLH
jgi:putative photosynthetic complex assembly protein 2